MQGVILAGGRGERLRPLTDSTPKPLIDVADRPLLEYGLHRLSSMGVDEIIIVVGYQASKIIDSYGGEFRGVPIEYAVQDEQNGLAHATLMTKDHVDGEFVLTYADVLFEKDVAHCLEHHRATDTAATLLVADVPHSEANKSGVIVTDKRDEVVQVIEKPDDPPTTLALPGVFVFSPEIFRACRLVDRSDRGEYELLDAIDLLANTGRQISYVEADGKRVNVNTMADLQQARAYLTRDEWWAGSDAGDGT